MTLVHQQTLSATVGTCLSKKQAQLLIFKKPGLFFYDLTDSGNLEWRLEVIMQRPSKNVFSGCRPISLPRRAGSSSSCRAERGYICR